MSWSWGSLPEAFRVTEADISDIIDSIEEKLSDSPSTHKEEVPSVHVDLRQIWKISPEHTHILQLMKWVENQECWLKTKDVGLSSFDLEEIPAIPELEARPTEKFQVKNGDKNKLDKENAQNLLKRGISMQAAIGGYRYSHQIPLDVLVDVTAEFMTNMGKLYMRNLENEKMGVSTGFSDPFERTLYELNIPGVRELDTFYRNRIVNFRRNLVKKCNTLKRDCEKRVNQIYGGFGVPDEQPVRSAEGMEVSTTLSLNDDASNDSAPQLRLGDAAIPGLEQGLRMLQSLEEGMDLEF